MKPAPKADKKICRPAINTNNIYVSAGYDHNYCHSIKKNAIVSENEKKVKDTIINAGLTAVLRNTTKKTISPKTKRKIVAAAKSRIVALMGFHNRHTSYIKLLHTYTHLFTYVWVPFMPISP